MHKENQLILPSINQSLVSLAFGNNKNTAPKNGVVLAGDVGGTKTNLALIQIEEGRFKTLSEQTFSTQKHNSFFDMVHEFQGKDLPAINRVCLGVAGPVIEGKVQGTNIPWKIDADQIAGNLHIESVSIMNDMEANAYGLAALKPADFEMLKEGTPVPGNAVIISPGTGLGEAGLYWDGSHYHPFASEGGHCDFSPRNDLEAAMWEYLHHRYKHVSWERVLSGPGIYDIYQFLIEYRKQPEPEGIRKLMTEKNPTAVISQYAIEGKSTICRETLDLFTRFLGIEAAQLALKMKSTGGVYIGGGIVPKIIKSIDKEVFKRGFVQSGRLDVLLELMPVKVVLNDKTALFGAAYYGAMM